MGDGAGLDANLAACRSVLDTVQSQIALFSKQVSSADAARLDKHLTFIRQMETNLEGLRKTCEEPLVQVGNVEARRLSDAGVVADLHVDLMLTAFRCGITNVATMLVTDGLNHYTLPHLGITKEDVHNLTHLADGAPDRALVGVRDKWVTGIFARIVQGLKDTEGPEGRSRLRTAWCFGGQMSPGAMSTPMTTCHLFWPAKGPGSGQDATSAGMGLLTRTC